MFMFLTFLLLLLLAPASGDTNEDWKQLELNEKGTTVTPITDHDMDNVPIQLKTGFGNEDYQNVDLKFFDDTEKGAGSLTINFAPSGVTYKIDYCQDASVPFPANLPSDINKVWTISLSHDYRMTIDCNGVEVANHQLSDTFCTYKYQDKTWSNIWTRDRVKVQVYVPWGGSTDWRPLALQDEVVEEEEEDDNRKYSAAVFNSVSATLVTVLLAALFV